MAKLTAPKADEQRLGSLAPAARSRLSEQVASRVQEAIVRGELRPGQHLVEADLASSLQVSKSPIREALRSLEATGLVTIMPRHGAYVRNLTVRDVHEVSELRADLEALAITLGLERADAAWIDELRVGLAAMAGARGNQELNQRHVAFHEILISRCDNRLLLVTLDGIRNQVRSFMALVERLYPDQAAIAADHQSLVEAVDGGDPRLVRAVVFEHIVETGKRLEGIWGTNPTPDDDGKELRLAHRRA